MIDNGVSGGGECAGKLNHAAVVQAQGMVVASQGKPVELADHMCRLFCLLLSGRFRALLSLAKRKVQSSKEVCPYGIAMWR